VARERQKKRVDSGGSVCLHGADCGSLELTCNHDNVVRYPNSPRLESFPGSPPDGKRGRVPFGRVV